MMDQNENIRVYLRQRPLNDEELKRKEYNVWSLN